jgi:hypothetical protein
MLQTIIINIIVITIITTDIALFLRIISYLIRGRDSVYYVRSCPERYVSSFSNVRPGKCWEIT